MCARSAFATGSPWDPGPVHVRDHRRQRSPEFASEILDASAVDRISLVQVRRKVRVAEFARSRLAPSAERLGASLAHRATLAAPEVGEFSSPEFTAHHRRAGRRQLA